MYEGHKKNPFCREGTVYGFFLKLHVQAIPMDVCRKGYLTKKFWVGLCRWEYETLTLNKAKFTCIL